MSKTGDHVLKFKVYNSILKFITQSLACLIKAYPHKFRTWRNNNVKKPDNDIDIILQTKMSQKPNTIWRHWNGFLQSDSETV